MPKILIQNLNNKLVISNDISKNILQHVHQTGIDWMHACGAKGRCTSCKMLVVEGLENSGPLSPFEEKCRKFNRLKDNERLACQCTAQGDMVIRVPDAYKLPHVKYTD
jgi:ferredoxin, 2Fe-2S